MTTKKLITKLTLLFFLFTGILTSCSSDDDPKPIETVTVTTSEASDSDVGNKSASVGGTFTVKNTTATEVGVEYKKSDAASFTVKKASEISSPFSVDLTELEKDTDYTYKAYAKAGEKTVYGAEMQFKTSKDNILELLIPIVTHQKVNGIAYELENNSRFVDKIAKQRWLFTHASVGSEMAGHITVHNGGISGLTILNNENWDIFKLAAQTTDGTAPSVTQKGKVYEYNRGNPGWGEKISIFADCLENGWASKVDVAFNKFCWIDQSAGENNAAGADQYIESMVQLEKKYPNIKFVYATMPLSKNNAENILRSGFNMKVRMHCFRTKRLLFDIADIQSHTPDGTMISFTSDGKVYETLNPDYTYDDGHLNEVARRRVALAWYAMAAIIAQM